jgi:glycosyltransferase EpsE
MNRLLEDNMNPEVTVLMSVYNDEEYLEKSMNSILDQTFSDFEFLIIDDASTDESVSILKSYASNDERIRLVLNEKNKGLSYNLAEGVEMAEASWIARMDADDIACENRLEVQKEYVENHPDVDIVGSYVTDIDEHDQEMEIRKVPVSHEKISDLIWTCPFIHPTVMFRKEAILEAGSYDRNLRRRQDYDLWFRCKAANLKFANIPSPILYYRSTFDYYKKNNIKVQFKQFKMGIKGARLTNAKPIAYVGITVAFLTGIAPQSIRRPLGKVLKHVDPRKS